MSAITDLIVAAREMRDAHGAHASAHVHGSPDYGELAKADKAARQRFEALAANLATAEALAALMPTIHLRSAADHISATGLRLAACLPANCPPYYTSPDDALKHFQAERGSDMANHLWAIWLGWRASVLFGNAWQPFLAAAMSGHGGGDA